MNINVQKILNHLPNLSEEIVIKISKMGKEITSKDAYYVSKSDREKLTAELEKSFKKNKSNGEYVQERYARDFAITYTYLSSIYNSQNRSCLDDLISNGKINLSDYK